MGGEDPMGPPMFDDEPLPPSPFDLPPRLPRPVLTDWKKPKIFKSGQSVIQ